MDPRGAGLERLVLLERGNVEARPLWREMLIPRAAAEASWGVKREAGGGTHCRRNYCRLALRAEINVPQNDHRVISEGVHVCEYEWKCGRHGGRH